MEANMKYGINLDFNSPPYLIACLDGERVGVKRNRVKERRVSYITLLWCLVREGFGGVLIAFNPSFYSSKLKKFERRVEHWNTWPNELSNLPLPC